MTPSSTQQLPKEVMIEMIIHHLDSLANEPDNRSRLEHNEAIEVGTYDHGILSLRYDADGVRVLMATNIGQTKVTALKENLDVLASWVIRSMYHGLGLSEAPTHSSSS